VGLFGLRIIWLVIDGIAHCGCLPLFVDVFGYKMRPMAAFLPTRSRVKYGFFPGIAMDGLAYFEILKKRKTNAYICFVGLALRMFLGSSCVYLSLYVTLNDILQTFKHP